MDQKALDAVASDICAAFPIDDDTARDIARAVYTGALPSLRLTTAVKPEPFEFVEGVKLGDQMIKDIGEMLQAYGSLYAAAGLSRSVFLASGATVAIGHGLAALRALSTIDPKAFKTAAVHAASQLGALGDMMPCTCGECANAPGRVH